MDQTTIRLDGHELVVQRHLQDVLVGSRYVAWIVVRPPTFTLDGVEVTKDEAVAWVEAHQRVQTNMHVHADDNNPRAEG